MKIPFIIIIFLFLISGVTVISSCRKDIVKGCMDSNSITYNPKADLDDGSCLYEGSAVIWYNQATANALLGDGATSLIYRLDDLIIGEGGIVYRTVAPDCFQDWPTIGRDLGALKNLACTLSVKDQRGFEYWRETILFSANTCLKFQLTWENRKKI